MQRLVGFLLWRTLESHRFHINSCTKTVELPKLLLGRKKIEQVATFMMSWGSNGEAIALPLLIRAAQIIQHTPEVAHSTYCIGLSACSAVLTRAREAEVI